MGGTSQALSESRTEPRTWWVRVIDASRIRHARDRVTSRILVRRIVTEAIAATSFTNTVTGVITAHGVPIALARAKFRATLVVNRAVLAKRLLVGNNALTGAVATSWIAQTPE